MEPTWHDGLSRTALVELVEGLLMAMDKAVPRLDEAAFNDLYRKLGRPLWSYVYRATGNAADADDIVQEAFMRLLRTAPDEEDDMRVHHPEVAGGSVRTQRRGAKV